MLRSSLILALTFSLATAGCTTTIRPERPALGVSNGTTLTVTLFVNGQEVGDFRSGAPQPTINVAGLPALPWAVEARSPSGRVLTSMHIEPGQIEITTNAEGLSATSGVFGRVDLSCGRLTIWAGPMQPSGPARVGSVGSPGDCAP